MNRSHDEYLLHISKSILALFGINLSGVLIGVPQLLLYGEATFPLLGVRGGVEVYAVGEVTRAGEEANEEESTREIVKVVGLDSASRRLEFFAENEASMSASRSCKNNRFERVDDCT
jgi:hypothetical protein